MENIIFGEDRKKLAAKSAKRQLMDYYKNEEEKNINNNLLRDLNPHYTMYSKSKSKQNLFRDNQRKFSSRRNLSVKNIYNRNETDQSVGNKINYNNDNMFDVQFPAINSYFHS